MAVIGGSLKLHRSSLMQLLLQRCSLVQLLRVLLRWGLRKLHAQLCCCSGRLRLRQGYGAHLQLRKVLRAGRQGGRANAGGSSGRWSLLRRHPLLIVQERLLLRGLAEVRRLLDRL